MTVTDFFLATLKDGPANLTALAALVWVIRRRP